MILYSTSACHLCEVAEQMFLEEQALLPGLALEKVDISDNDELFERYGLLIPVLRRDDGSELRWPFDQQRLRQFLSGAKPA